MEIRQMIVRELRRIASEIECGNCNLSTEEMFAIMESVSNVYLNKEEACKLMNVSRPTFDRMVNAGLIPDGKKQVGYKQLVWKRSDLINKIINTNK